MIRLYGAVYLTSDLTASWLEKCLCMSVIGLFGAVCSAFDLTASWSEEHALHVCFSVSGDQTMIRLLSLISDSEIWLPQALFYGPIVGMTTY